MERPVTIISETIIMRFNKRPEMIIYMESQVRIQGRLRAMRSQIWGM